MVLRCSALGKRWQDLNVVVLLRVAEIFLASNLRNHIRHTNIIGTRALFERPPSYKAVVRTFIVCLFRCRRARGAFSVGVPRRRLAFKVTFRTVCERLARRVGAGRGGQVRARPATRAHFERQPNGPQLTLGPESAQISPELGTNVPSIWKIYLT